MRRLLSFVFLFAICHGAHAQLPAGLSFMSGEWYTQHEWGEMTEYWSQPNGNTMVCAYQCVQNGNPVFYEFITIENSSEDGIRMYLRHFGPKNKAKEKKDGALVFALKETKEQFVLFENLSGDVRLSYNLLPDKRLKATLYKYKNEVWERTEFVYQKK